MKREFIGNGKSMGGTMYKVFINREEFSKKEELKTESLDPSTFQKQEFKEADVRVWSSILEKHIEEVKWSQKPGRSLLIGRVNNKAVASISEKEEGVFELVGKTKVGDSIRMTSDNPLDCVMLFDQAYLEAV
jgi:hypothetical protein